MKKRGVISLLTIILALGLNKSVYGQSIGDQPGVACPGDFDPNYYTTNNISATSTQQSAFSSSAIVTCGNFRMYFEDVQQNTNEGFDDPVLGSVRRNTVCAVLTYIQSVLKITTTMDLHFVMSLTPLSNPANSPNDNWIAQAGPIYKPGTYGSVPGFFGGNLYDHITTGIDPDPTDFDAQLGYNFHQVWSITGSVPAPSPVDLWDDYNVTTPSCKWDLFNITLHELTHCLGFASGVADGGPPSYLPVTKSNTLNIGSYTKLDQYFLYFGDPRTPSSFGKLVVGPATNATINPAYANVPNFFTNTLTIGNSMWMTNSSAPNNYKAYDGYQWGNTNIGFGSNYGLLRNSYLSHLDRAYLELYRAGQHSPGFQPKYVISPIIYKNEQLRNWSIQEIRILQTLGYNLNPTFAASTSLSTNNTVTNAALLTNSPPCRTNTVSLVRYPLLSNADYFMAITDPETKPADFVVTNNNVPGGPILTTFAINTNTLPNIGDLNGQPIGIYPNSFYGVKGVTTGGNNHNCIALTGTNTITYTPPAGFYGRAEFGFNFWDGLEKGGSKIITIDVLPPAVSFTIPAGNEMVINGSFEDATEVMTASNLNAAISTRIDNHMTELNYAAHQAGGHPYIGLTYWGNYFFSGCIRNESYRYCFLGVNTPPPPINPIGFGSLFISSDPLPLHPLINSQPLPVNTNTSNECFAVVPDGGIMFSPLVSTLMKPLQVCKYYRLEFDATQSSSSYSLGSIMSCSLLAVNNLSTTITSNAPILTYNILQSIPIDYTVSALTTNSGNYSWQHVIMDFVFCGPPTSTVLLKAGAGNSFAIDNISIKENTVSPPPLIITATNSSTLFCPGSTATLTGHAVNSSCATTFTWLPMNTVSPTVAVTPASTTAYTLLANDGCRSGSAIVTPSALPAGSFTIPSLCIGQLSPPLLSLLPSTLSTSGTFYGPSVVSLSAAPYIDLRPSMPNFTTLVGGVNNYTYVIPYPNGCFQTYTFNAMFIAVPSITATPICSPGQSVTLSAFGNPGPITYTWLPGSLTGQTVVVTPTATTTYTLLSSIVGCPNTQTYNVWIPNITFTNVPTTLCTVNQWLYLSNILAPGSATGGVWTSMSPAQWTVGLIIAGNSQAYAQQGTLPGTYTLSYTYTNSFNCSLNAQFTVNVLMTPTVTPNGTLSHCLNIPNYATTLTAVSTSSLPMSYTWNPGNLSGPNPTVIPTNTVTGTDYTVVASDGTCTSQYAVATVTPSNKCCGSNTASTTFNYMSTPLGTSTLSGLYAVNQNVIITGNVTLDGEFYVAPNVSITVAPGGYLNTKGGYLTGQGSMYYNHAHLLSCNDMWSGIVVNNAGQAEFENLDLIEDAKIGISSNSSTNTTTNPLLYDVILNQVAFNRCDKGVAITNYTQTTNNASPFTISGCVFTCRNLPYTTGVNSIMAPTWQSAPALQTQSNFTNALAPPYNLSNFTPANLKTPMNTGPSTSGVQVENSGLTINPTGNATYYSVIVGDQNYNGTGMNLFDNLNTGINCINSNVSSYNNTFQNTQLLNNANGYWDGVGIRSNANNLNYNSYLNLATPSNPTLNVNHFYDCNVAIRTTNVFQVNVQYAEIRSTQSKTNTLSSSAPGYYGMIIEGNRYKNYTINNNKILNTVIGIYLGVTQGTFNLAGWASYGQVIGTISIKNNLFSSAATQGGSPGNGFMNYGVNAFNMIYTKGGLPTPAGVYTVSPASGLWIQNNIFDQVYRGAYVTNFSNSTFGKYTANNLFNISQDHIPTQPQWGARYDNNYFGIANTNTIIGTTTNLSTTLSGVYFSMNTNSSAQCNSVVTLPMGMEFAGLNSGTSWKTNTMSVNARGMELISNGIIGTQGTVTAPCDDYWQGTWPAGNYNTWTDINSNAANSKIYRRNLNGYNPLSNSGLVSANTYSIAGRIINANTSAPYLACTPPTLPSKGPNPSKSPLSNALASNGISYQGNFTNETSDINSILLYQDLEEDSLLLNSDPVLQSFFSSNQSGEIGAMTEISQYLSIGDFASANSSLNNFTTYTTIEANYKLFFQIYSKYFDPSQGVLSATDQSNLDALANLCPFIDGPVVYQARALDAMVFGAWTVYNDEGCDNVPGGHSMAMEETLGRKKSPQALNGSNNKDYKLYPNPATDKLYITGSKQSELLDLEIRDVTNKLIRKMQLQVNGYMAKMDLDLLNGIYFVILENSDKEQTIRKLIIAK